MWWNGRHERLKIFCILMREGSSPSNIICYNIYLWSNGYDMPLITVIMWVRILLELKKHLLSLSQTKAKLETVELEWLEACEQRDS